MPLHRLAAVEAQDTVDVADVLLGMAHQVEQLAQVGFARPWVEDRSSRSRSVLLPNT